MYANLLTKPLQGSQFVSVRDELTGWVTIVWKNMTYVLRFTNNIYVFIGMNMIYSTVCFLTTIVKKK